MHLRAIGAARVMADTLTATPRAKQRATAVRESISRPRERSSARRRLFRRHLILRLTSDRALPIAVAVIVLMAAGVSLAPAATPVGAAQEGAAGRPQGVRLAVGGGPGGPAQLDDPMAGYELSPAATPADDGTLYKPVAVDTSVKTSAGMLDRYRVKEGDTLTSIANRFDVSMMTVWWANDFTSKDSLKTGMDLVIPPVSGLIHTVKVGDSLDTIAAANKIEVDEIVQINDLDDPNLIVGQVLVLPGAKGAPMPTPKPTPTPKPRTSTGGGAPVYTGGAWAWPVIGGGNYISQYFKYGHLGVDIAGNYGSSIVSSLSGRVVFAGWKSNGGGYQVWIAHGNGLYSAHHHMSTVAVSTGQNIARGQRIGRIGQSGWATGPHDHFEVWVGSPWTSGAYRVNPLRYF